MGLTNNNKTTVYDYTFSRPGHRNCFKCGKEYKDGDNLFHKRGGRRGHKSYHLECWEKMQY